MGNMGLEFGLEQGKFCKRRHRFLFFVEDISADGANALPPLKSARPNLSYKEMIAKHLIEDVHYPAKPEWKPVTLTLYDLKNGEDHPVFEWTKELYDPQTGSFREPNAQEFIKEARVELYNGCGDRIEGWVFEDVWPQASNFQNLDMGNADVMTVDITLRYVRAFID
jgi:hypothetical protein